MSTQSELNQNPAEYILYFCIVDQKDSHVYEADLSDLCTIGYDGNDNLSISGWLPSGYSAPSNATLLTFTLATVHAWHYTFYEVPPMIADNQYFKISSAQLANVRTDSSMIGYRIFDTTAQTVKYWSGSAWV